MRTSSQPSASLGARIANGRERPRAGCAGDQSRQQAATNLALTRVVGVKCRLGLTIVSEQGRPGQISREQFRGLTRGVRLLDRQGREWTVRAAPFVEDGEYRVVLHDGDLVLIERERFADSYALANDDT